MRSWIWIAADTAMLVAFIVLQVWRFTGVPLHEWLAVALIAAIVAHLAVHWVWVETRTRRIRRPRTARTRVNYAVNAVLFGAMAVAMISGFAISKVVLPLHPAPGDYVRWHGIHELSSRIAVAAVAPNVRFAVPLIANAAAVALGALIGRRVLRLRLD